MLKSFPSVARWGETGDVAQNALIRLHSALAKGFIESTRHYWNLAALEIRRELMDLARHYLGPEGQGAKHHTEGVPKAADDGVLGAVHGHVFCLDDLTGAVLWQVNLGEPIAFQPAVAQGAVYAASQQGSLFRIAT